tara:strand:+ start:13237 stop:14196 length:960 start_codon:yes stop_codon:yes gene_type:complete
MGASINHLSTCSGYAGFCLALRELFEDCRTIAHVEIEAFACANLVAKMEAGKLDSCPIWTDLRTFDGRPYRGLVDVLSGGFPCQPFSLAGKREADKDPRHIFPHLARVIDECKPSAVFLENVNGILTSKMGGEERTSVLKHVLGRLEEMHYTATFGVFAASEVGAPHKRSRVFILAVADIDRWRQSQLSSPLDEDRHQSRWHDSDRCSEAVADVLESRSQGLADSIGEEERSKGRRAGTRSITPSGVFSESRRWPALPGKEQFKWESPRTLEPGLERTPDERSRWVDRLRLLGNGIVPAQAAHAYRILSNQLREDYANE